MGKIPGLSTNTIVLDNDPSMVSEPQQLFDENGPVNVQDFLPQLRPAAPNIIGNALQNDPLYVGGQTQQNQMDFGMQPAVNPNGQVRKSIGSNSPYSEISFDGTAYDIYIDLPGVIPSSISASIDDNFLQIEGTRKTHADLNKKKEKPVEQPTETTDEAPAKKKRTAKKKDVLPPAYTSTIPKYLCGKFCFSYGFKYRLNGYSENTSRDYSNGVLHYHIPIVTGKQNVIMTGI